MDRKAWIWGLALERSRVQHLIRGRVGSRQQFPEVSVGRALGKLLGVFRGAATVVLGSQ